LAGVVGFCGAGLSKQPRVGLNLNVRHAKSHAYAWWYLVVKWLVSAVGRWARTAQWRVIGRALDLLGL